LPFGRQSGESALSVSMAGGPQPWPNAQPAAGAGDARIRMSGLGPESPTRGTDKREAARRARTTALALFARREFPPAAGLVPTGIEVKAILFRNAEKFHCLSAGSPVNPR